MTETTTVTMETLAAQQALVLGVLGWLVATGLALVLAAHWRRGVYYSTRGWLALAALPALGLWAVLAQQVATQGPLTRWDAALTQALHTQVSTAWLHWATWPTRAGDPPVVVALTALVALGLWWRKHHLLALAWVAAVVGNALLNKGLKHLFERDRPAHWHGVVQETGYSFPSGHASGTLATYGMLAYLVLRLAPPLWHVPALLGAAWLAWMGACSRVLLQVHYASDVLAGLASGSVWLGLCIVGLRYAHAPQALPVRA